MFEYFERRLETCSNNKCNRLWNTVPFPGKSKVIQWSSIHITILASATSSGSRNSEFMVSWKTGLKNNFQTSDSLPQK